MKAAGFREPGFDMHNSMEAFNDLDRFCTECDAYIQALDRMSDGVHSKLQGVLQAVILACLQKETTCLLSFFVAGLRNVQNLPIFLL